MVTVSAATAAQLFLIFAGILLSTTATTANAGAVPSPAPSAAATKLEIGEILSNLGFQDLAATAAAANLSAATIFAPTDASLLTCPGCSAAALLREHAVAGLYPLHFLRRLAFGTKIESFAANCCLTVTASAVSRKIFNNGAAIAKPDFFNNGLVIVHALQGYIVPLSSLSCAVESMVTLSFTPQPTPPDANTRLSTSMRRMLKDAMRGLRVGGYSIVALAIRVRFTELLELKSMTLFAIDDVSVFVGGGGGLFVAEMGFHIVPNRLLRAADLMRLPIGAALPTMERRRNLVVTTAGGGGPLAPMRINFAKVDRFDLVVNKRVAVHGLSMPFRDVGRNWISRQELVGAPVRQ